MRQPHKNSKISPPIFSMKRIAIFASGTGSNATKIIEYFQTNPEVSVDLIVSNKKSAKVLETATSFDIETLVINRSSFYESEEIVSFFKEKEIDLIVLAGFLWLVPAYLVQAFPNRIINIHPALLPKYGGKGMYGINVHRAVKEAGEKETGLTIHFVNEKYDEGGYIFKAVCQVNEDDTPEMIAAKVLKMEHTYFPKVVEQVLKETATL